MSIGREEARKVAHLARIRVEDQELDGISRELSAILGFMEQLNEVDIEGVSPMSSVTPMKLRKRRDEVRTGDCRDKILLNAPLADQGFFSVPKVVE